MTLKSANILTAFIAIALASVGCKEKQEASAPWDAHHEHDHTATAMIQQDQDPDESIVTVNGQSLTRGEMNEELDMITASPEFSSLPPDQAAMVRQQLETRVMERYISQQLLTTAAESENIEVSDEEIDEFLDEIRLTLPEGITLETIMEDRNIPLEKLRRDIGADIRIRKLLESKTASVAEVSEEQIAAFYESNKEMFSTPESIQARHILISVDPDADEETVTAAREKADSIRQALLDGEAEFDTAAQEHSDCPSGQRGGDLGLFSRGQMVPEFEKAAFSQEIEAIGDIVQTQFGFHIVQVTAKQAEEEASYENVKEEIGEQLMMQQRQNTIQSYLEKLREAATITYGN